MSNVLVDRQKIDILANAISDKSGVPVTMTLAEMVEAVDSIETGGGEPNLQAKTYTVDSAGTATITADSGYDGLSEVEVSVPSADPFTSLTGNQFITENNQRKWTINAIAAVDVEDGDVEGWLPDGFSRMSTYKTNAVPSNTSITPTEYSQTIGGANYMMEGAVTVNAIPSNYVGSGITRRDSTDLSASGATVTVPSGYYESNASKAVESGSLGVPTNSISKDSTYWRVSKSFPNFTAGYFAGLNSIVMEIPLEDKVVTPSTSSQTVTPTSTAYYLNSVTVEAVPSGMAGTPTATKGSVSNHSVSVTPSVTNTTGYITGSTKTGTAVTVTASELASGNKAITQNGTNIDVVGYSTVSVAVPSTQPTIQSLTVTPTTSQQTFNASGVDGYKPVTVEAMPQLTLPTSAVTSGHTGTKRGSVRADGMYPQYLNIPTGFNDTAQYYEIEPMDLGEKSITENGTYYAYMDSYDGYSSVTVNVSGGGGSTTQTDWIAVQSSMTTSTLTYTGLKGEPTSFIITIDDDLATGSPAKVAAVVFDGTNLHGQTVTNTSNAQASYDTGFTKSYSNGTLTVTATNAQFQSIEYCLAYTYGGSAGDVYTKDVQVGSGATSITFSNLEDEPIWWSCIFKSNFSTSSGYQRVMYVTKNVSDGNVFGMCLDSSGHNVAYWTATYNNGSFTITSQGTNQGGYFHQPGYYQLTYAVTGGDGNYQSKTVTPTTSQQVVEADSGYDALKRVTVNAMPSGSTTAPASISGTAASISTGTNTLTLTKTVSVTPTVSAGYVSAGTAGNSSISLTASVTTKAAATITPTTTNQTIAAGTYLTGAQTIAGDADLVGGNILSTANIFGVQGTVVIQNYYTGSSAPSSSTGSNGDLYLQS